MSQKLLHGGFKWVKNITKSNKDFMKKYNEHSNTGYFLEVFLQYSRKLHKTYNGSPFFTKNNENSKASNTCV